MIFLIAFLVVITYFGACTLAGFGPAPSPERFASDSGALVRHFAAPPGTVLGAYRAAAGRVGGMRVVAGSGDLLFVDLRPTARVLGGNFGLVMRLRFTGEADGCSVVSEAMNKVPFAFFSNNDAAFGQAESALRMAAKRAGIRESLPGIDTV